MAHAARDEVERAPFRDRAVTPDDRERVDLQQRAATEQFAQTALARAVELAQLGMREHEAKSAPKKVVAGAHEGRRDTFERTLDEQARRRQRAEGDRAERPRRESRREVSAHLGSADDLEVDPVAAQKAAKLDRRAHDHARVAHVVAPQMRRHDYRSGAVGDRRASESERLFGAVGTVVDSRQEVEVQVGLHRGDVLPLRSACRPYGPRDLVVRSVHPRRGSRAAQSVP